MGKKKKIEKNKEPVNHLLMDECFTSPDWKKNYVKMRFRRGYS